MQDYGQRKLILGGLVMFFVLVSFTFDLRFTAPTIETVAVVGSNVLPAESASAVRRE